MTSSGPELTAVIAELAGQLPPDHVAAWATVLRSATQQDAATQTKLIEARLIEAKSGFALSALAARLMAAWRAADPPQPGVAIALALETAALVQADSAACRSDVVISGPASDSTAVRLTSSVISELIHDSQESLLVVSFAAFGVTEVVRELQRAARRGVRIDLILESTADQGGTLHGPVGASAAFEAIRQDATFWAWPENRRTVVGASRAALRAGVKVGGRGLCCGSRFGVFPGYRPSRARACRPVQSQPSSRRAAAWFVRPSRFRTLMTVLAMEANSRAESPARSREASSAKVVSRRR